MAVTHLDIAVYVMHSMQWAGITFLVPKEDNEILEGVRMEDVMKFIVSAGAVSSGSRNNLNGLPAVNNRHG